MVLPQTIPENGPESRRCGTRPSPDHALRIIDQSCYWCSNHICGMLNDCKGPNSSTVRPSSWPLDFLAKKTRKNADTTQAEPQSHCTPLQKTYHGSGKSSRLWQMPWTQAQAGHTIHKSATQLGPPASAALLSGRPPGVRQANHLAVHCFETTPPLAHFCHAQCSQNQDFLVLTIRLSATCFHSHCLRVKNTSIFKPRC